MNLRQHRRYRHDLSAWCRIPLWARPPRLPRLEPRFAFRAQWYTRDQLEAFFPPPPPENVAQRMLARMVDQPAEVDAILARDVANGCGIITID